MLIMRKYIQSTGMFLVAFDLAREWRRNWERNCIFRVFRCKHISTGTDIPAEQQKQVVGNRNLIILFGKRVIETERESGS